jgi:hypothetical protein
MQLAKVTANICGLACRVFSVMKIHQIALRCPGARGQDRL